MYEETFSDEAQLKLLWALGPGVSLAGGLLVDAEVDSRSQTRRQDYADIDISMNIEPSRACGVVVRAQGKRGYGVLVSPDAVEFFVLHDETRVECLSVDTGLAAARHILVQVHGFAIEVHLGADKQSLQSVARFVDEDERFGRGAIGILQPAGTRCLYRDLKVRRQAAWQTANAPENLGGGPVRRES